MQIVEEYSYRNGQEIIEQLYPHLYQEIHDAIANTRLDLNDRQLSQQIQNQFLNLNWDTEVAPLAIPEMRYDCFKEGLPIEIEIGHQRLVYADFFEFLADYSAQNIQAAVMIVTHTPQLFGHNWHNSLESTRNKLQAIQANYLVPIYIISVDP